MEDSLSGTNERADGDTGRMNSDSEADIDLDEIERKLRLDYRYSQKDDNHRLLDSVQSVLGHFRRPGFSFDKYAADILAIIRKRLHVREVTIALYDPGEGAFSYRYMDGLRPHTWEAHKNIRYRKSDLVSTTVYRPREISKYSTLFLAEDNPYGEGEEDTYSRPIMLKSRRTSVDDSIEGDYIDVWIHGPDGSILGWIEASGTLGNKLPDATAVKWLELLAGLLSMGLRMVDENQSSA